MRLPHIRQVVDTAQALRSDLIVLLGDYKAWYKFKTEPVADEIWAAELAPSRPHSVPGRSSATTIGGTILPVCAAHLPVCAFPS